MRPIHPDLVTKFTGIMVGHTSWPCVNTMCLSRPQSKANKQLRRTKKGSTMNAQCSSRCKACSSATGHAPTHPTAVAFIADIICLQLGSCNDMLLRLKSSSLFQVFVKPSRSVSSDHKGCKHSQSECVPCFELSPSTHTSTPHQLDVMYWH